MNIINRRERLDGRLALSLILIVSNGVQIVLLGGSNHSTAQAAQKPSASLSKHPDTQKSRQVEDTSFTRPRRAEARTEVLPYASAGGPIVRVALMIDITSIAITSQSGVTIRRATTGVEEAKAISSGSLRVELRQQREQVIQSKANPPGAESITDTNARAAKYKAQSSSTSPARPAVRQEHRAIQLIAVVDDRIAAVSENELVISPTGSLERFDPGKHRPLENHQDAKSPPGRDQNESSRLASEPASSPATIRIGNKDYRGEISLILNPRGRINVVNALPLEEYLRGVVPLELSPGAYPEIEALKAQAVAARSYALAHLGQHRTEGFDLVDDTRAQVYGGFSAERELTNRAIEETRGIAAVFPNEEGKLTPIEALYTANCGGRTENNEEVFGGKSVPYLRAVACSSDRQSFAGRDIVSGRMRETLAGIDGRAISREVGLMSVLGFSLPRRITNNYLSRTPDPDEVKSWIEQTARLTQRTKPRFTRGDSASLTEFAHLVAASVYGEGRASTLLAPADVDYLLGGIRVQHLPGDARADLAMLLRDGIFRLPADALIEGRAPITRALAIETLGRALSMTLQPINQKSQISAPQAPETKSLISTLKFQIPDFKSEIAVPSENGRLIVATRSLTADSIGRENGARFKSVNTSAPGRLARPAADEPVVSRSSSVAMKEGPPAAREGSKRAVQTEGLEIVEGAWLFRTFGGESLQVDRLTIIGGERVAYHLNEKGQVDFLEASLSDRSASSDRFSSVAQWQERIAIEELQQRLARAGVNVGRVDKIEPLAFSSSSRVTEVEVTGDQSRAILRRPQIRIVLGLKEYLFVVDRETDVRGQVVAFVFTGRGWGHGVGMCQTGAYGLAKEGYTYPAILQKYYTATKLQKMY